MNVFNLESTLNQKINNSTSTLDILIYSKALQELKTGTITTVDSPVDLPNPNLNLVGHLFFEKTTEFMYVIDSLGYARKITTDETNLYTWGANSAGALGDSSTTSKSSPDRVAGGGTDWRRISMGGSTTNLYSAAVKKDGTLWTWGANAAGQLGDGTTTSRSSPATVSGGGTNWISISLGDDHSVGVKSDGTLWTWGGNTAGQLGDGTTTSRSSPATVSGGGTDWCFVSAGNGITAAIKTDGSLWTWGANASGQLGDNATTSRSSPARVAGGGMNWCSVSMGNAFAVALKSDGSLWTWGLNSSGQLGDGSITNRSSPVTVSGGGTNWCAASAGCLHTVAAKSDGTLWTWGANASGQLGDGTTTSRSSPATVVGGGTTWCAVAAGTSHTVAAKTDGKLWTWGSNAAGQLGDGTSTSRSSPSVIVGLDDNWIFISAKENNTGGIKALAF